MSSRAVVFRFLACAVSLFLLFSRAIAQEEKKARAPDPAAFSADPRFKAADALFSRVGTMLTALEGLRGSIASTMKAVEASASGDLSAQARKRLQQKCLADFSIAVIAAHKTPPLVYGSKSPIDGMVDSIRRYYECEAFSRRKPALCGELSRYQNWESEAYDPVSKLYGNKIKTQNKPEDFRGLCAGNYKNFSIIQLLVAGRADAVEVCKTLPFTPEDLRGTNLQKECELMTSPKPDPHCKRPRSPDMGEEELMACLEDDFLRADESACPSLTKDVPFLTKESRVIYQSRCQDLAAYRRAYRAKDAKRCGNSLVCRMLMGEDVCDRYLDKLKGEYCRSWTQENLKTAVDILSEEQRTSRMRISEIAETLKQRQAEVEALLSGLSNELENFEPKSDPAFASRIEAYRALRGKVDKLVKQKPSSGVRPSRTKQ